MSCARLLPDSYESCDTATVSYKKCHNFKTERFYQRPVVTFDPCMIWSLLAVFESANVTGILPTDRTDTMI